MREDQRITGTTTTHTKPFRFGVSARHARSRTEWTEKARKIEDLGYATLSVPDHLTDIVSPMPAVVSAAEATKGLQVGTMVLNNDYRHPVLLAREAATIDLLSDGRFQLGLGAGSMKSEYQQAGLEFETGRTRVERLAEAVRIIKGLWSGEPVDCVGHHYRVRGHVLRPLPVQKPHPPILIGGNGRRLLTLAAEEADVVGLSGLTFRGGGTVPPDLSGWLVSAVDERVALVRKVAGEDRYRKLELSALVQQVLVTDTRQNAAEELAKRSPPLGADAMLASPYMLIGTVDQMIEDLQTRRRRWGISYYVIHEEFLDALAPVVARLSGK